MVQDGLEPHDWNLTETVGPGTKEIRILAETGYSVPYVAKFSEAVYVPHAFVKKTRKTSQWDLDLGAERCNALLKHRGRR